jgi:hypothetical protein
VKLQIKWRGPILQNFLIVLDYKSIQLLSDRLRTKQSRGYFYKLRQSFVEQESML